MCIMKIQVNAIKWNWRSQMGEVLKMKILEKGHFSSSKAMFLKIPKNSQLTRSIDREGKRKVSVSLLKNLCLDKSIDRSNDQTEIYCEKKSSLLEDWGATERSSEIKWMLAIRVSFESPESRARWTDWMKRSNGVVEDDEEPIGKDIGVLKGKLEVVGNDEEGATELETWTGRSVRGRGSPKASSPLSRMANPKRNWEYERTKDQLFDLNFLEPKQRKLMEFQISQI